MPPPQARSHPVWWAVMVVVLAVAVAFCFLVGSWIQSWHGDRALGRAVVGQWLPMTDFGLELRVDEVTAGAELPATDGDPKQAHNGLHFVKVLMTVRAQGSIDDLPTCFIRLRNAADEEISQTVIGFAGPRSHECWLDSSDEYREIEGGVEFRSQTVFLVAPAPVESFDLIVQPQLDRYWRVDIN